MTHELKLTQWHHGYLGMIIIILGIVTYYRGYPSLSHFMYFVGGYVLLDDFLQHLIQWLYDDSYQSPLRYLYTKWIWEPLHK